MKTIGMRLTLALLALGLLSACGFQLRGQVAKLQGLSQPLAISGVAPGSPLGRELRVQLQQAGAELAGEGAEATVTLRISASNSAERVIGLDSRNRATEYELLESLRFSLREEGRGERIPEQSLRVTRTLFAPQNQVLSGQQEAQTLREDMRRELVNRLIRRLSVLL